MSKFIKNNPILSVLIAGFLTVALISNLIFTNVNQNYVYLADSFINGRLDFQTEKNQTNDSWHDTTPYKGRLYWPLGPTPAIILTPFVIFFGTTNLQNFLLIFITLSNLFLLYKIAFYFTKTNNTALWLATSFLIATNYIQVALIPSSWFFAQAVATCLLLLAFYELYIGQRVWLIGIYIALLIGTRISMIPTVLLFIYYILYSRPYNTNKSKNIFQLTLPVLIGISLLALYNFFRFGSFIETGYAAQSINGLLLNNRAMGTWSTTHIPGNLYYLLLNLPHPIFLPETKVLSYPYLIADPWGISILLSSPILFWLYKVSWKDRLTQVHLIVSVVILTILLGQFGNGGYQNYSYRYALDFTPILFILLIKANRQGVSILFKTVVVISFLINLYFCLQIYFLNLI